MKHCFKECLALALGVSALGYGCALSSEGDTTPGGAPSSADVDASAPARTPGPTNGGGGRGGDGDASVAEAPRDASSDAPVQAGDRSILFQGFHWRSASYGGHWYETLASKSADLAALGVTHVWFPPPSDSAADEGYLPRQLDVLDSKYGSEASLRSAVAALRSRGIESVADIVVNHRVGTKDWADFTRPAWGCEAVAANDEWSGRCGGNDTGEGYGAARDLDHAQPVVRNGITTWLRDRVKGVGFSGLRFDFAKGFAPTYVKGYRDAFGGSFCVGEIWGDFSVTDPDAHRQTLVSWIDGTDGACSTFDFTTKGLLNDAFASGNFSRLRDKNGKAAGAIGYWPARQVTFVDNHDTGPAESCGAGQNLWPVACDKVMAAYAYVLSHPGVPTVFYPHVYDWNLRAPIAALIAVRRRSGIDATSPLTIERAEDGLYAAKVRGATCEVAVKLGTKAWDPGAAWRVAASGDGYALFERTTCAGGTAGP